MGKNNVCELEQTNHKTKGLGVPAPEGSALCVRTRPRMQRAGGSAEDFPVSNTRGREEINSEPLILDEVLLFPAARTTSPP